MNTGYGAPIFGGNGLGYQTVETLLDDVSRQMASSNLTKYSRGSSGQRGSGGSMRIAKPNSTSNSPRGSIGLGRRRTVMTDRRRVAMTDPSMSGFVSHDGLQIPARSNRPMSWHPSTQLASQPQYHSAYPVPSMPARSDLQHFDFPPTPAVYSGYGSPDSTFSPLSMPYQAYEQNHTYSESATPYQSSHGYDASHQELQNDMPYYSTQTHTDPGMHTQFEWNNYTANNFESSTAPPTPDFYLPIQHPEASLPVDDAIPYHSLSDSEPEGEILQGLGLYDAPETPKSFSSAPHFDNYRALVMSQLLGSPYKKHESEEATGKGLKLEETWNPPPSDDEDDEDDDEQDGEGEDDDEPVFNGPQQSNTFVGTRLTGLEVNPGLHASWL